MVDGVTAMDTHLFSIRFPTSGGAPAILLQAAFDSHRAEGARRHAVAAPDAHPARKEHRRVERFFLFQEIFPARKRRAACTGFTVAQCRPAYGKIHARPFIHLSFLYFTD
jgi:hypothetical protein